MKNLFLISLLVSIVFFSLPTSAQVKKTTKGNKSNQEEANKKRIGVARIQIFASPAKHTAISDIANMPLFFGANSDELKYKKTKLLRQLPPTVGDSIRDFTADSFAVFFKQDIFTMSGYDDAGGNSKGKRNMIHDLPTENPQKMAVDSIFDEAIDLGCYWTFALTEDKKAYIPTVMLKMEVYDRSGQARPEKSVILEAKDIKTSHFKSEYGVNYDFVNGIKPAEIEDGGIVGNVVADVYLQALNKLLKKLKE